MYTFFVIPKMCTTFATLNIKKRFMSKQLPKVNVKVCYRFPDVASAPPLVMESFNKKLGKTEYLYKDGRVTSTTPTEHQRSNLEKIIFAATEKWVHKTLKGKTRSYYRFSYVPENYEHELKGNPDEYIANRQKRLIHAFITNHANVYVPDSKGDNINSNLQTALFELIDESAIIRNETEKNIINSQYRPKFTELMQTNPESFIDFCYALAVPNIHMKPVEELYNTVIAKLESSPEWVRDIYESSQRAFFAMINRAVYEPIQGTKDTVISLENNYYMFNGHAIGKDLQEVLNYFNANPSAYKALEQKMGRYIEREVKHVEEPQKVSAVPKEIAAKPTEAKIKRDNVDMIEMKRKVLKLVQGVEKDKKKGTEFNDEYNASFIEKVNTIIEESTTDVDPSLVTKYTNDVKGLVFNMCNQFNFPDFAKLVATAEVSNGE